MKGLVLLPALLLLAGALIAFTIGWPIIGAVEALGWPAVVYDADGPDVIAADRIVDAHQDRIVRALDDRPHDPVPFRGRDCLEMLIAKWIVQPHDSTAKIDQAIRSVMVSSRGERDVALARRISERALIDLPHPWIGHPVLGGLAGCIDGSLFSAVCGRWASQRIGNALKAHRAELIANFIENADRSQQMACRAVDGETPSDKSLRILHR